MSEPPNTATLGSLFFENWTVFGSALRHQISIWDLEIVAEY